MPANPPPNSQTQLAKRTTHNALPTHLLLYTTNNNDSSIKPKRFPLLTSLWAGTTVAVRWSKPLPPGGMLHARAAGTVDLPNAGAADCHLLCIQLRACFLTHSSDRMRLAPLTPIILTITRPTPNAYTLLKLDAPCRPPHQQNRLHPKYVPIIATLHTVLLPPTHT